MTMDHAALVAHLTTAEQDGGHGATKRELAVSPLSAHEFHEMSHDYRDDLDPDHEAALTHTRASHEVPIEVGATVAHRGTGETLGQVDSIHGQVAIVSWPAPDLEPERVDARGRRGQAFALSALIVVDEQPSRSRP